MPSRAWALLQALAYAGACIDPSGVLAIQRLHRSRQQTQPPGTLKDPPDPGKR